MPDPNSKPPKKIRLPMLPMRDIVVFPHMTAPFFIGRPLSIAALEEALSKDR
ncbi:MAG: LON peptidase substrate-binding domain-containing protein, partial [SAR324 cluster bacterium]|nr:LON peptidase substrate-binding domain-containing protein [SAR324 cluster bacterium]